MECGFGPVGGTLQKFGSANTNNDEVSGHAESATSNSFITKRFPVCKCKIHTRRNSY